MDEQVDRRLRECVERWPEAEGGAYDPRCCRFPKSCSADVIDGCAGRGSRYTVRSAEGTRAPRAGGQSPAEYAQAARDYATRMKDAPVPKFYALVSVETDSQENAMQVLKERLEHDEDYGFEYVIDYKSSVTIDEIVDDIETRLIELDNVINDEDLGLGTDEGDNAVNALIAELEKLIRHVAT